MNFISKYYMIAKGIGWDNVFRRAIQICRQRSGYLHRILDPKCFSDDMFQQQISITPNEVRESLRHCFQHFMRAVNSFEMIEIDKNVLAEKLFTPCEKALQGQYLMFGNWFGYVGWPPNFNLDPKHNIQYPTDKHSLDITISGPPFDDAKLVWEASRFSLAYYFARAFALSHDEKWADAFWEMFDAWIEQNPPMKTIAWACGQESTFRMMAILFAATVTMESTAATDKRMMEVAKLVWRTGLLIDKNINYAVSQKNNHGISEAVGLITAALVLQNSSNKTNKWKQKGKQILEHEIKRQIYNDGSFVQHSMNYHRVMLDDLLWLFAIDRSLKRSLQLPSVVYEQFEHATEWLREFIDIKSGRCPNYGSNDGAQVLPLSCCDYTDYRPVIQAAWNFCHKELLFDSGIWDEKLFWLTGNKPSQNINKNRTFSKMFAAPNGGYYVMRGTNSWCMTRCHRYRDRPAQSDMLHFDLWIDGENVIRDGGSYHYYTTESDGQLFHSTLGHNTIVIDGLDQMVKGQKFLWFYWTKSKLLQWKTEKNHAIFEGEHYGYERLSGRLVHRRKIERFDDHWTIVDTIFGKTSIIHQINSQFRLAPGNWNFSETQDNVLCQRDDGLQFYWKKVDGFSFQLIEGWESLYYAEKRSVPIIHLSGKQVISEKPFILEYEFYKNK